MAGLVRLAWPIAVSTLSYTVMTLVGTAFVGRLGPGALAGVGLGGIASFTLLVFALGLCRGVKILVSQAVGAGREREIGLYVGAGLMWAIGLGVIEAALGQLVSLWIPRLAASEEAGRCAALYLRIRVLSAPILLVYVVLQEASYGRGNPRAPMIASLLANAVNVALDALFIFGLGWGVAGAAWSTVIAHSVEAATLSLSCTDLLRSMRGCTRRVRDVWRMGLPTALQFMVEVGAFAALSAMISRVSELDMAGHQIALHAIHFSFLPAFAVGEAASVMAGQAVGADRDDLVRQVARRALLVAGGYTALCTLIVALGGRSIAAVFTDDASVIAKAATLLAIASVFQIADAANIVARSVLRGTGDVRFAAVVGVVVAWAITPPLCWVLGIRLGWGAAGGWIGLCGEIMVGAGILWWRLSRGGWRRAAARSRAEVTAEVEARAA
jgi:MATE family multidrug resistance protein